jgi:hypothetical protein
MPVSDLCVSGVEIGRLAAEVGGGCQTLSEFGDALDPADVCDRPWPDPGS